jgi:hypothetical protein
MVNSEFWNKTFLNGTKLVVDELQETHQKKLIVQGLIMNP